jgi:hypothetical protein
MDETRTSLSKFGVAIVEQTSWVEVFVDVQRIVDFADTLQVVQLARHIGVLLVAATSLRDLKCVSMFLWLYAQCTAYSAYWYLYVCPILTQTRTSSIEVHR